MTTRRRNSHKKKQKKKQRKKKSSGGGGNKRIVHISFKSRGNNNKKPFGSCNCTCDRYN